MAKQTASRRYFHVALADQFRYYLAPDFFLMGMLKYSSARVIKRSRASVSNLEKERAFSSSLMRFFNCAFSSLYSLTKTEMHLQIYYPGLYKFDAYYVKQQ